MFFHIKGGGPGLSNLKTRSWTTGWGDALTMYQQIEDGFWFMRATLPVWGLGATKGQKLKT